MATEAQTVVWQVEGMTCMDCANTIEHYLKKDHGVQARVDYLQGQVQFEWSTSESLEPLEKGINSLGYHVVSDKRWNGLPWYKKTPLAFAVSLALTLPFFLEHLGVPMLWLHHPAAAFGFASPVLLLGSLRFGKGALASMRMGKPNMDVLILTGAWAAFLYSAFLMMQAQHHVYFETTASIITFVLLGNWIEERALHKTGDALKALAAEMPATGNRISLQFGKRVVETLPVHDLRVGDLLLVRLGETIPTDGEVVEGIAELNEQAITGESLPVLKHPGNSVMAGTRLVSGSLTMRMTAAEANSTLNRILMLVREALHKKPAIQNLADRISGRFVWLVLGLTVLSIPINLWLTGQWEDSLLRAVAILVVSCPCAMGLATPTAVTVGLGASTRLGVLVRGADTLERLAQTRFMLFDKTGTLTSGQFHLEHAFSVDASEDWQEGLAYMAQQSNHPLSMSLAKALTPHVKSRFQWVKEHPGVGMEALDEQNRIWWLKGAQTQSGSGKEMELSVDEKVRWHARLVDTPREGIMEMLQNLIALGIQPVLVSGDKQQQVEAFSKGLPWFAVWSDLKPDEKRFKLLALQKEGIVVMVGDGINDAPALAQADVGISLEGANGAAKETAQVVMLNPDQLNTLPKLISLSKETIRTIKQNLYWAFSYNLIAIPVAALGGLSPMIAALSMATSDLVVIGNALLLAHKVKRRY
jgi:Cu+-exporting ATPase